MQTGLQVRTEQSPTGNEEAGVEGLQRAPKASPLSVQASVSLFRSCDRLNVLLPVLRMLCSWCILAAAMICLFLAVPALQTDDSLQNRQICVWGLFYEQTVCFPVAAELNHAGLVPFEFSGPSVEEADAESFAGCLAAVPYYVQEVCRSPWVRAVRGTFPAALRTTIACVLGVAILVAAVDLIQPCFIQHRYSRRPPAYRTFMMSVTMVAGHALLVGLNLTTFIWALVQLSSWEDECSVKSGPAFHTLFAFVQRLPSFLRDEYLSQISLLCTPAPFRAAAWLCLVLALFHGCALAIWIASVPQRRGTVAYSPRTPRSPGRPHTGQSPQHNVRDGAVATPPSHSPPASSLSPSEQAPIRPGSLMVLSTTDTNGPYAMSATITEHAFERPRLESAASSYVESACDPPADVPPPARPMPTAAGTHHVQAVRNHLAEGRPMPSRAQSSEVESELEGDTDTYGSDAYGSGEWDQSAENAVRSSAESDTSSAYYEAPKPMPPASRVWRGGGQRAVEPITPLRVPPAQTVPQSEDQHPASTPTTRFAERRSPRPAPRYARSTQSQLARSKAMGVHTPNPSGSGRTSPRARRRRNSSGGGNPVARSDDGDQPNARAVQSMSSIGAGVGWGAPARTGHADPRRS